jgi:transketolase
MELQALAGAMKPPVNLRRAYGEALVEEGRLNPDIVVLDADLSKSTMSFLFKEAFPDRFFEMGIAEQNMTAAAAGFALAGKIPFTHSFAAFAAGRAYDQIRCSVAIPGANVKITGSSCGLSDFGDGKTHQSVEDGNIIAALPNMTVLNPCDGEEARQMVKAMVRFPGPVYLRINRNDLPVFTPAGGEYRIGRMSPVFTGKEEVDPVLVIFATGVMVWKSVIAAELFAREGINVRVINVSTLKPLRTAEVLRHLAGAQAVVVAEEAVKTGGLGAAIAAILLKEMPLPFDQAAIDDQFGLSARSYEDLLDKYNLGSAGVYDAAKRALAKVHRR